MGKRNREALLPTHLPQLQNLIKRDPKSYEAEFLQQYRHFQSSLAIFCLKPDEEAKELSDLVMFMSHVLQCYPKETAGFPEQIVDILKEHCMVLHPEVRKTLVQALILMRHRGVIDNTRLLPLFFTLFKCKDKHLREQLYTHIVTDIKTSNAKAKNNKLNKTLQSYMFTMLESAKTGNSEENAIAAKKSIDICIDLYNKNVWNDAKTVNVIAEACFSPVPKIAVTAIKFFLTSDEHEEEESDDEEVRKKKQKIGQIKMQQANVVSKKTKSKARKMDAAKKKIKRKSKAKEKSEVFNFSALHLLNDAQGFAEKLHSKLASKEDRWEIRVMKMNLVSRVIGLHQLIILGFYPMLIKYLQPSQKDVTMVLVSAAQASHPLVPPDVLETVLKAIANNFVTDRVANEVMAVGLNGIREICARQPLAIDVTLLQDLTQYKNHRDKSVMMAARSLIALFREINPEMLMRKDRGKTATVRMKDGSIKTVQYGSASSLGVEGFQGIELLEEADIAEDENAGWEGWEEEEESDSDEDGWINVGDGDEPVTIAMSDDEDEKPATTKTEGDQPKTRRIDAAMRLASTRILTPADFAKLNELKVANEAEIIVKGKKRPAEERLVDEFAILGPRKKAKQDYEERMASIQEGREGREKFGSKKGNKDRGSTTNREKSRNKNYVMIAHKRDVVMKAKRSMKDKQVAHRAAIEKQKK
ncbi:hypothetical protein PHYBLDRAFT_97053, partial [Phycomyces blakesleeanus NRRL 1555(-)]